MSDEGIIAEIRDLIQRRASADLLIDARTDERWTYERASEYAAKLGAALRAEGVEHGDRVVIIMENSPAVILAYLAALYLGAVIVPVNRAGSAADIGYAQTEIGGGGLTLVSPRTRHLASGRTLGLTLEGGDLFLEGRSVLAHRDLTPFEGVTPDDAFSITLTSGSTGRPKGVVHSIATLFGNARSFNAFTRLGEETIFLHGLPMSYMAGLLNSIVCPFMAGGTIVVAEEFSARTLLDFWSVPRRYGVNTLWATPTLIAVLLELDRTTYGAEHCRSHGVRMFVGTAALSADHRSRFESKYGIRLRTSYGLSELLLLTVRRPDRDEEPDSVGAPLPAVEVSMVGGDQATDGEICVRTPYAALGYWGLEGPLPEPFMTGDLGRVLQRGELLITGRKKDLIITGGVNVSPVAVEEVMRAHPRVRDVVAVGVPDAILGEAVALAVVLDPSADARAVKRDLMTTYAARLGQAQRPRHVVIVDQMPRSPNGKIRRADVRALVTSGVQRP